MKRLAGALAGLMLLAGCNAASDEGALAEAEARGAFDAAATNGRIDCALEGAKSFARNCTVAEMSSADGSILVVGRNDVGYRRLEVTTDGRGLISADGAEPAAVSIIGDDMIEVAVGTDRYRLPANTNGN